MKTFLRLCLVIYISTCFAHASAPNTAKRINGLLRFIAHQESIRQIGLYGLIARRCNFYLPYEERVDCREAVKRQIRLLDYDIIFTNEKKLPPKDAWTPEAFVFIAFKKTLVDTLSEHRTTRYLDELKKGLNDYLTGANPHFNIWDMTLNFYQSPLTAAKVLSALFQDTSIIKLHIAYLERSNTRGRMAFGPNLQKLSKVIDTINLILDYSEDSYRGLFYPHPLRQHLHRNIYHFYVPLYLSMALGQELIPKRMALVAPLLLTLTYEFITSARDYRYLLKDPARLDPVKNGSTLRDIFAGYSGANFGLGKNVTPDFFYLLKESFGRRTREGVDLLLRSYSAN